MTLRLEITVAGNGPEPLVAHRLDVAAVPRRGEAFRFLDDHYRVADVTWSACRIGTVGSEITATVLLEEAPDAG